MLCGNVCVFCSCRFGRAHGSHCDGFYRQHHHTSVGCGPGSHRPLPDHLHVLFWSHHWGTVWAPKMEKTPTGMAFIQPIQIIKHSLHVSADGAQRCYHHDPDRARPRDWVHHHCGRETRTATKQRRHHRRLHRCREQSGSVCRELTPPLHSSTFAALFATNCCNFFFGYQLSKCGVHLIYSISKKS